MNAETDTHNEDSPSSIKLVNNDDGSTSMVIDGREERRFSEVVPWKDIIEWLDEKLVIERTIHAKCSVEGCDTSETYRHIGLMARDDWAEIQLTDERREFLGRCPSHKL